MASRSPAANLATTLGVAPQVVTSGKSQVSPCGVARYGAAARRLPPARTRALSHLQMQPSMQQSIRGPSVATHNPYLDTPTRELNAHERIRHVASSMTVPF